MCAASGLGMASDSAARALIHELRWRAGVFSTEEADDEELAPTFALAMDAGEEELRLENAEWSDSTASISTTDASLRWDCGGAALRRFSGFGTNCVTASAAIESAKSNFHGLDGPDENCEAEGDGVKPPKPEELERSSA